MAPSTPSHLPYFPIISWVSRTIVDYVRLYTEWKKSSELSKSVLKMYTFLKYLRDYIVDLHVVQDW